MMKAQLRFFRNKPIYGFSNNVIRIKGRVTLPMTLRQGKHTITIFGNFIVIDHLIVYNSIFDQPIMVIVAYFLTIMFPTMTGVGFIKVDLKKVKEC